MTGVINQWSNGFARPGGFMAPGPAISSTGVPVTNSAGNWLVAIVSWRQDAGVAGTLVYPSTVSISDDAGNYWIPARSTLGGGGVTRSAVWYAPGARAANWVFMSNTNFQAAATILVLEVSASSAWSSLSVSNSNHVNQGTSISWPIASPPSGLFAIATLCADNNSVTVTPTATSWTALTTVTEDNGSDNLSDMKQLAWSGITGTASNTISATASGNVDMSGVTVVFHGVADLVAAPVMPNPLWPQVVTEIGYGSYLATEPDNIVWTDISARLNNDAHVKISRGIQYNQQSLEAGTCQCSLDNFDGAFTPGNTSSPYSPNQGDDDIPFRLRALWAGGTWQVQFHGNGSVASPQIDTGRVFTVTPGLTYQVSMWLAASVAWASGMVVSIQFFNASSVLLATFSSVRVFGIQATFSVAQGLAPAGAVSAAVIVQARGTPPAATVFSAAAAVFGPGSLIVPPAIAWAAENSSTITASSAFSPSRSGPPNATPYYQLFTGVTDKNINAWDPLYRGYISLSASDCWSRLTSQMLTAAAEEVLADNPQFYWPCTDIVGSTAAHDTVPGAVDALTVQVSKNGRGSAVNAFGGNTITLPGDPNASCWTCSGMVTADTAGGYSLTYLPTNPATLPPISGGVTHEFWFNASSGTQPGTSATKLVLDGCYGPKGPLWQVLMINTELFFVTYDQTTGAATQTTIELANFTGQGYIVATTFTRTTWACYVDGGAWSASGTANFSPVYNGFILNGQNGAAGLVGSALNCSYYGVAVYPAVLPPSRIVSHYAIPGFALQGGESEDDSDRVRRVLGYGSYIPVLAARGMDIGSEPGDDQSTEVTGITDTYGQVSSSYITNMAQSSLAAAFVGGNGAFTYRRREQWYNRAIRQWVLGTQPFMSEVPYEITAVSVSKDRTQLYNTAVITQSGTSAASTYSGSNIVSTPSSGVIVQTENIASVALRSSVPYTATSYLLNTAAAPQYNPDQPSIEDFGNWIVNTQGSPVMRFPGATISPSRNFSAWLMALGAEVGDSVTTNVRPIDGANLSVSSWLSRLEHDISFAESTWDTTYQLSPSPQGSVLQLDSMANGVLDGTNLIGW